MQNQRRFAVLFFSCSLIFQFAPGHSTTGYVPTLFQKPSTFQLEALAPASVAANGKSFQPSVGLGIEKNAIGLLRNGEPQTAEPSFSELSEIPAGFSDVFQDFGLLVSGMSAHRLAGNGNPPSLLTEKESRFILGASIAQALGAAVFISPKNKAIKEVADGNAVDMTERSILAYTRQNSDEAILILGDEGARDESFSLEMGAIYFRGKKHSFRKMRDGKSVLDREEFRNFLNQLDDASVVVRGMAGDALEKTNGIIDPDVLHRPTDSTTLLTMFGDSREFVIDHLRVGGISYNGKPADVTPFDLPSVFFEKLAKAEGVPVGVIINNAVAYILGPRPTSLSKGGSTDSRHDAYIQDLLRLQTQYPGLEIPSFYDGDCMPRLASVLGLKVRGKRLFSFGRSGAIEATSIVQAAALIQGAEFPHTYVSRIATDPKYSQDTAYHYSNPAELDLLADAGIELSDVMKQRHPSRMGKKGWLAMASVTGASPELFGEEFAGIMKRVQFLLDPVGAGGSVVVNSLIVRSGEAYVVRTVLQTKDLEATKHALQNASAPARDYFRGHQFPSHHPLINGAA